MNIFYLDIKPKIAAQYHNNSHCVKMILESAQLLCTAHRVLDGQQDIIVRNNRKKKVYILKDDREKVLYQATHINHPSCAWSREVRENYNWLYCLFVELCEEYTYRYEKVHKCEKILKQILYESPSKIKSGDFTQPPLAMPERFHSQDPVKSYREYYMHDKKHLARWTKREKPDWYIAD